MRPHSQLEVKIASGNTTTILQSSSPAKRSAQIRHWRLPGPAEARRERGRLLDLAIADCTEAIRLDSSLASPWCERGWARLCKQDHDGACSDCAEALRLDPSNQDILLCMRLVDAERLKNAANGI
eukprot:gnl/TRDRNA2_/TRDRNA2_94128_c0_seq1.p1 gnl/TRDRNA2_/TRDRNA2_94128_c0~~gnl/TRDRNA2_/TRDRNA2_94128_c0_seq1.p1  ORF type:complete len:125 (-),score=13.78 gnl/TRDRNA2_/TRDRNA2_94128_c0_seq1:96-470(-)